MSTLSIRLCGWILLVLFWGGLCLLNHHVFFAILGILGTGLAVTALGCIIMLITWNPDNDDDDDGEEL